ncbi:DUF262 domain-containing protein [Cupriavidus consociatus]|uniref:DUF262 domain-containing protein n=1 Tax=Cupriavidus consociatus TaxID=2821357 RepID=UPI001AE85810|nr:MULTISPECIES: DUF262 domain-containing protein [unclassified Cupriavidus]MBP0622885.1 DUF262 domain-containing protein [Cupriavidus sp. LEh25]MDK2659571.1 DUF262 domain-containing protein [Cupriavidus sp. LEh21]
MRSLQTSYADLFTHVFEGDVTIARIEVPILQRDFAQGRQDARTRRIRENFLDAIVAAITGGPPLSLDFVYGDVQGDALLPLDGQQRLTALFLLHWYLAARCDRLDPSLPWLRLTYATRASARMFCQQLAKILPTQEQAPPSRWITDQPWFLQTWEDDPTIQSMLVVLDDLHRKLHGVDLEQAWRRLTDDEPAAITFHILPMKAMGLGDDIYIKMNSRGKPLTEFELFKARFERLLESSSPSSAREFARKIDGEWADVFWRPDARDGAMDAAMVRYIRYLTDVCVWHVGQVANPAEDLESLALRIYGSAGGDAAAHVDRLLKGMDAWVGVETNTWFASKFVSQHADAGRGAGQVSPLRLFRPADRGNCDLFAACCRSHDTGARNRDFGWPEALLLYASLLHRLHRTEDVGRRLRVVRNLIEGSADELRGDRMPELLEDVRRIIVDGQLDTISGFNQRIHGAEERAKRELLQAHPALEPVVFELEDHPLLRGCLVAFELDAQTLPRRARAFAELFSSERLLPLITGALLAAGDYAIRVRGRFFLFGSSRNLAPWRDVFSATWREDMGATREALSRLLDHVAARGEASVPDALQGFVDDYLSRCEQAQRHDWRYYFVKYDAMREGASGRYVGIDGRLGYSVCMLDKQQMNSYYRDPYLHAVRIHSGAHDDLVDKDFTGYETVPRWMPLKKSDIALRAVAEGFHVQVPSSVDGEAARHVLAAHGATPTDGRWLLSIPQAPSSDGPVDTVDRVQRGAALVRALVEAGY